MGNKICLESTDSSVKGALYQFKVQATDVNMKQTQIVLEKECSFPSSKCSGTAHLLWKNAASRNGNVAVW